MSIVNVKVDFCNGVGKRGVVSKGGGYRYWFLVFI